MNQKLSVYIISVPILVVLLHTAMAHALVDYEYGNPTPYEQAHLEAINRARANPLAEAARHGIDLFEGVPQGELTSDAKPPLAMNARLLEAARLHSEDMLLNDFFDHYSQDGSDPFDRMEAEGYQYNFAGENIAYIGYSRPLDMADAAIQLHDILFVDTDYPDRGHRTNLLNPEFREAGVGLETGDMNYGGQYSPYAYMITCDFGARYSIPPIVTGVVFRDNNNDLFYDPGEELPGVRVNVEETAQSVTTGDAGAYGIPLNPGTYNLHFLHSSLGEAIKTVTVSDKNIKLDLLASDFTPSPPVSSVDFTINSTNIGPGDHLEIDVNSTGDGDLYVLVLLPGNQLLCFLNTNTPAALNVIAKFSSRTGGKVLDMTWPDIPETRGEYIFGAVIVKTGANPLDTANWLAVTAINVAVSF